MNTWTTPLRTALPLTYDGEQFTIAEIEGRRILLQQISAEGRPPWRQIDLSMLMAHPSTEFLVETPSAQPAVAATLGQLSTAEEGRAHHPVPARPGSVFQLPVGLS